MINYLVTTAQASSQAHESGLIVKDEPAPGTRAVPNRWAVTSPENHPTQKEAGNGGGRGVAGPRRMAGKVGAAPVSGESSSGAHSAMPAPIPAPVGVTAGIPQRKGLEERRALKCGASLVVSFRRPLAACPCSSSRFEAHPDTFTAGGLAAETGHVFSVKAECLL